MYKMPVRASCKHFAQQSGVQAFMRNAEINQTWPGDSSERRMFNSCLRVANLIFLGGRSLREKVNSVTKLSPQITIRCWNDRKCLICQSYVSHQVWLRVISRDVHDVMSSALQFLANPQGPRHIGIEDNWISQVEFRRMLRNLICNHFSLHGGNDGPAIETMRPNLWSESPDSRLEFGQGALVVL